VLDDIPPLPSLDDLNEGTADVPFEDKPPEPTITSFNKPLIPEMMEHVLLPKESSPVIGIDLGTTFSCVAVWENDRPVVIANNSGHRTTPSWVSFQKDNILVGEAAYAKALRNPGTTIYDAKRLIGRKFSDEIVQQFVKKWPFRVSEYLGNCAFDVCSEVVFAAKKLVTPEEVSAYVLAKMKYTAEDYLGCNISRAVITVPAYFNDSQRQATIDAATIAGLKVERIINEPTSAALAYGIEKSDVKSQPSQNLLIYDLGGGTLDVTILVIDGPVFEVKSTSGDTNLGGQDFDNNLVDFFMPQIQQQIGQDISNDKRACKKLRDACCALKHALSHSVDAQIEIDALVNGEDFESSLTRQQFIDINQELFQRCLLPVDKALNDAYFKCDDIHEVVLIGGSTRIVHIQELLAAKFPKTSLSKRINPDEAVAMGAAIQGANLSLDIEELNLRLSGITLMDVTPMSLGIELANGKMSTLIDRNTTLPFSHTRVYKNNESYQTEAVIEVFEGENAVAKQNRLLGRFTLPGLPPRLRGQVKIPVTFSIDVNGVLEVAASVGGEEGSTKKIVIQKDKGLLSDDEIKKLVIDLANWENKCRVKHLN
jgi:L1 cell adhesion molecule like protein